MGDLEQKAKYDFLSTMYKSMWDNINRHVTALWQSTAVLGTAFGAALLIKTSSAAGTAGAGSGSIGDSTPEFAVSVVIAACCWLIAHAFDAANWYNRNIQILGNIESVFFALMTPAERVHPYGDPNWRRQNEVLPYMRLQAVFGAMIALAAFGWHFVSRVMPWLDQDNRFDFVTALPAIVLGIGAIVCGVSWWANRKDFAEFLIKTDEFRKKPPVLREP
jgi:hypothetical protein